MILVLEPLHELLEAVRSLNKPPSNAKADDDQGPTTARETSFAQVFGRELHEAREACRRWRMYADPSELDKAWDIYYGVCTFTIVYIASLILGFSGIQESGETVAPVNNP